MATKKVNVLICDICGFMAGEADDLDTYGLRLGTAFYAGTTGGGGVPKGSFVCETCIRGDEELEQPPLTVAEMLSVIVFEADR